jgi:hypothetical protein
MVYEAIPVAAHSATIKLTNAPMTVYTIGGPVALLATCQQIREEDLPILRPQLEALTPTKLLMKLPCGELLIFRTHYECRREVEPILGHLYKCVWNATCKETCDGLRLPAAFGELARTDPAFLRHFLRHSGIVLRKPQRKCLPWIELHRGCKIGGLPPIHRVSNRILLLH